LNVEEVVAVFYRNFVKSCARFERGRTALEVLAEAELFSPPVEMALVAERLRMRIGKILFGARLAT
jgi:hypothetical protein